VILLSLALMPASVPVQGARPTPPPAPYNLSATAASASQINLRWVDASSNESGFIVQRSTSSSGPWTQVGTAGANAISWSNTGLAASTAYYYRVCAYNSRGSSAYTAVASATTSGTTSCTYSLSSTSASFDEAAASGSIGVTAGAGCSWTASSGASWITITSGFSGSGNGTVWYSVAANTSTTARNGTLTVAGRTFTVYQSGAPVSCSYSLSALSTSVAAASSAGSVTVYAGAGCAWSAYNNTPAWITITAGSSGSGNGTVSYSVAANTSTTARSGTLTIAGRTFTVNQAGASVQCTYSLSATSASVGAGSGVGSVNVTAGTGCSWMATANASWLSITAGFTGSGNGSVSYSFAANTATTSRSGTLTIAGQTFTVNQAANTSAPPAGAFVKRFGGTATDYGTTLAVAGNGDFVVAGSFAGAVDFGGGVLISSGGGDMFIARYSAAGTHLWSKRFGTTGTETATSIDLDASGNIFVGGYFVGVGNFGGNNLTSAGQQDGFLAKYSPEGAHQWSQQFGSTAPDVVNSIAADSQGNVIMTGYYQGTVPLFSPWVSGGVDVFLAKFSPAGATLWAKNFSNVGGADYGYGVAVDRSDNIVLTGYFIGSINFGGGALNASGVHFGYLAKFSPAGTHIWSKSHGANNTWSRTVAVDSNGDVVMSGEFQEKTDLGGGVVNGTAPFGGRDVFVSKYSGVDGSYRWAKFIVGSATGQSLSLASDSQNNIFLAGCFQGTYNFDGQSLSSISPSVINGYLCKYSSAGTLVRVNNLGGTASAGLYSVAVDSSDYSVVTGCFSSSASFAGQTLTSAGSTDIVLGRLAP
jgi:hypothetical protein